VKKITSGQKDMKDALEKSTSGLNYVSSGIKLPGISRKCFKDK